MSIEASKTEKERGKKLKTSRTEYPRTVGQPQSVPTYSVIGIPKGEENETKEIIEEIMSKNFPKLMTDPKPQTQEAQKKYQPVQIINGASLVAQW